MGKRNLFVFVFATLLTAVSVDAAELGTDQQKADGKVLYEKYCNQCHGDNGDVQAPAAPYYKPAPRDFTGGKYKVRNTAGGELPTDQDLANAIRNGLAFKATGAYTVMPPWPNLSEDQVMNIVYYIKSFSSDFADPEYNNPKTVAISSPISTSEKSVTKGREVFEKNECIKCHGNLGRSDGRSAPTLEDDWENHIFPANLRKRWTYRGGSTREDIFRTITTGFNGTPMPAYGDTISEEDRWHLVNYIYSLSDRDEPSYNQADDPVTVVATTEAIDLGDFEKATALFEGTPEAIVPIVGQVVEPGREFHPSVTEVVAQAIYNDDHVAIKLSWDDMRSDKDGANAPDIDVPLFEPPSNEESDDPFGEEEEDDPFAEEEEGDSVSDAIAVQIPSQRSKGSKKPYFVFGDSANSVDLWFADMGSNGTQEYLGKGSEKISKKDASSLTSVSNYQDGTWTTIFRRDRAVENGISFTAEQEQERFIPVGFSVWDGFEGEQGNKRGLTSWYSFYLKPAQEQSVLVPVLMWGLGLLLLELLIITVVRSRTK